MYKISYRILFLGPNPVFIAYLSLNVFVRFCDPLLYEIQGDWLVTLPMFFKEI